MTIMLGVSAMQSFKDTESTQITSNRSSHEHHPKLDKSPFISLSLSPLIPIALT